MLINRILREIVLLSPARGCCLLPAALLPVLMVVILDPANRDYILSVLPVLQFAFIFGAAGVLVVGAAVFVASMIGER